MLILSNYFHKPTPKEDTPKTVQKKRLRRVLIGMVIGRDDFPAGLSALEAYLESGVYSTEESPGMGKPPSVTLFLQWQTVKAACPGEPFRLNYLDILPDIGNCIRSRGDHAAPVPATVHQGPRRP